MNGEGDAKQHAKLPLSLKCKISNFFIQNKKKYNSRNDVILMWWAGLLSNQILL